MAAQDLPHLLVAVPWLAHTGFDLLASLGLPRRGYPLHQSPRRRGCRNPSRLCVLYCLVCFVS